MERRETKVCMYCGNSFQGYIYETIVGIFRLYFCSIVCLDAYRQEKEGF